MELLRGTIESGLGVSTSMTDLVISTRKQTNIRSKLNGIILEVKIHAKYLNIEERIYKFLEGKWDLTDLCC